ncbi:hypothetical protein [Arcobacter sp. 15-2]|uniref:hypothetical protein n=1 Tax=Arcobacter sp. 15-2 TaxID=3374109 RepID=UPI00399C954A
MSFNECTKLFSNFDTSVSLENKFFHFVYNKINKNTKNRFVERGENSIDIIPSNDESIRVIPIFKNMDKNNLMLDTEIAIASKIIEDGEMKCIYFVYPKNENFDKHIQIKVTSLENACSDYMIKIIPYSLRDLYKKGIKNENCNILCK